MISDDEINALIEKRNEHRKERQYAEADVIKQSLRVRAPGIKILDTPFKQGGGSSWFIEVVLPSTVSLVEVSKEAFKINDPTSEAVSAIVQEAKKYCDLCEQYRGKYEGKLRPSDTQGRQWADAAFHFAMAGVKDVQLYTGLIEGARAELKRVGNRKSFRTIDIIQMAEKFAGAGVLDQSLYSMISNLVQEKTPAGVALPDSLSDLQSGKYMLLSDRPLFALFRFAARQSKHGRQRKYAAESDDDDDDSEEEEDDASEDEEYAASPSTQHNVMPTDFDVNTLFENPNLPLVLDLGCGYGVSLLGMSYTSVNDMDTAEYNYLGCDMAARSMNFANGIAQRWNMHKQCAFIVSDIVKGLELVQKYVGSIHLISINFPTPYRQIMIPEMIQKYSLSCCGDKVEMEGEAVSSSSSEVVSCNSQLPSSISDFMVTSEVYQRIEYLFCSSLKNKSQKTYLYMQSNVQDVAIVMNGMLHTYLQNSQVAQESLTVLSETSDCFDSSEKKDTKKRKHEDVGETPAPPSKRKSLWNEKGGKASLGGYVTVSADNSEHINGDNVLTQKKTKFIESSDFWLEESPLPGLAKTETEVMCKFNGKPVYRQLFSFTTRRS